jgi:putative ABC transport system permease protein
VRLLATLAARNLLRHKRRTFLTVSALALGIGLMILGRAWTAAMERGVVEPAKNSTLGHVQVYAKDAAADEGGKVSFILPQNNYRLLSHPRVLIDHIVATEPRIAAGLSRLMIGSLLSAGENSMEGILIGIDPGARTSVYPAMELREGRFFQAGEFGENRYGVLLNRGVAKKLGAKVGDTITALGNATDGRLTAVRLIVTGVWTVKGLEAYEWGACFTDIEAVRRLLDVEDSAGLLVLRQRDPEANAGPIAAALNARFDTDGVNARAYTWEEMGGPFIGGVTLTRFIASITNVIMALIVAAGVANTALMAVFERTREIGTIRATGARRSRVIGLFLFEAVVLGLLGAFLGAALGAAAITAFGKVGIPAFSEAQRYSYGGDYLYPQIAWQDIATIPALMLVVCVVAALGPAIIAARLRPADALRAV